MTPSRGSETFLIWTCLVVSLLVISAGEASGQVTGAGVRAGVNVSTMNSSGGRGEAPVDPQARGVVAGYLTWRLFPWLELQPEAAYSLKGGKTDESGVAAKALLDYLEVPIVARVTRGAAGARRVYGIGGGAVAVLLRARTRAAFGGATEEIDISEDVETLDWGVVVGGGVELGAMVIDLRYTHGLRDIDADRSDQVKVRNRAASLTAGLRF